MHRIKKKLLKIKEPKTKKEQKNITTLMLSKPIPTVHLPSSPLLFSSLLFSPLLFSPLTLPSFHPPSHPPSLFSENHISRPRRFLPLSSSSSSSSFSSFSILLHLLVLLSLSSLPGRYVCLRASFPEETSPPPPSSPFFWWSVFSCFWEA